MKVTWLGQAGLLFDTGRVKIMVDPYFSDSVGKRNAAKHRRLPIDKSALDIRPDILIVTHDHLDHLDPESVEGILSSAKEPITVIAPDSAYRQLLGFGGEHNYVMLNPHSVWSQGGVTIYAVKAEHSDRSAAGYIIDDNNRTYYVSGDTLYNYDVIDDLLELCEDGVDFAFLPINGVGNNMNINDAADFAYEIGAKHAIPIHFGMFDSIDPENFDFEDRIILKPFEETVLK